MLVLVDMVVRGLIAPDQSVTVSLSYDNGSFVEVATIDGDGSYVDAGQSISVGAVTVGSTEVGGGGSDASANPFEVEFRINTDKFERVKYKFEATEIGYVKISMFQFKDIRYKGRKSPAKYISS